MEKTYTFANNALAAAFVAAVVANHKEDLDAESLDTCGLSHATGRFSIELSDQDEILYLTDIPLNNQETISTLAALELAIGEALATKPATDEDEDEPIHKGDYRLHEDDKTNEYGYTVILRRDGRVAVGCKRFTPDGADKIIAAANTLAKGGKFARFTVHDPSGEYPGGHEVVQSGQDLIYVSSNSLQVKHIQLLARMRSKLMGGKAKAKPAPAPKIVPFRLFPAARKKAVKKVSKK